MSKSHLDRTVPGQQPWMTKEYFATTALGNVSAAREFLTAEDYLDLLREVSEGVQREYTAALDAASESATRAATPGDLAANMRALVARRVREARGAGRDTGCGIRDAGSGMRDSGSAMREAGFEVEGAPCWPAA